MSKALTHTEYISQLQGRHLVPLDSYAGAFTKIRHQCIRCHHIWNVTPKSLKNKASGGCPKCYQLSVRKPLEQVEQEIFNHGWTLVDTNEYQNSYRRLQFQHRCGNIIESNVDLVSRNVRKCQQCYPSKKRQFWSNTVVFDNRSYASKIEMECCEFLISHFGGNDILLQKIYPNEHRKSCDAYIKSIDTYVEVSTINKKFYLDRIYDKRQLVKNFIFVSSIDQLKQILNIA